MNDVTKPTSRQPSSASLDVDLLFAKLGARYGRHWLDMWAECPIDFVKAEWHEELRRFHPAQVTHALAHLGKFPPTLPEFADLCTQFRRPSTPAALALAAPREKVPTGTFKRLRNIIGEAS